MKHLVNMISVNRYCPGMMIEQLSALMEQECVGGDTFSQVVSLLCDATLGDGMGGLAHRWRSTTTVDIMAHYW